MDNLLLIRFVFHTRILDFLGATRIRSRIRSQSLSFYIYVCMYVCMYVYMYVYMVCKSCVSVGSNVHERTTFYFLGLAGSAMGRDLRLGLLL
jgi:hypothetical protein